MKLRNLAYTAFVGAAAIAFVIGSAVPSEAAKKKAAAAPPPPHSTCWFSAEAPVCATKGGMKFTYVNSCYAAKDGAKVSSQKACPAKAAKKGGKKKAAKKPAKKKA